MLPEPDYESIGKRVRRARLEKRYSQEMLAEKINCSNNYISHIETGQTKVSLRILLQISYVLDLPLDYFLLDTPYVSRNYLVEKELAVLIQSPSRFSEARQKSAFSGRTPSPHQGLCQGTGSGIPPQPAAPICSYHLSPFYHLNTASLLFMFFPMVAANSFPRIVYFFISSL